MRSESAGMKKDGEGAAGYCADGVCDPIREIAAAAMRGEKLVPFVCRSEERNGDRRECEDADIRPWGVPAQRQREEHRAEPEAGKVRGLIPQIKHVDLRDL